MRPKTLFRDLQFIASFVPATVLDKTEKGKAFWDAGLAALGVKQDVVGTLCEIADEVVVYYTQTRPSTANKDKDKRSSVGGEIGRGPSNPSLTSMPTSTSPDTEPLTMANGEVMKYSMSDAARMWSITAREGDPAAERELAIFYLTHPELLTPILSPLSKPSQVFKAMAGAGGGRAGRGGYGGEKGADGNGGKEGKSDPATMCVAYHWMELSALGGDELARTYLRQREEMGGLP